MIAHQSNGVLEGAVVTTRRKIAGLLFGLFYGGSLINGFDLGLAHVARIGKQELAFDQWPWLGLAVFSLSVVLMGFLGGYVARSTITGSLACGIGAVLLDALPRPTPVGFEAHFSILISVSAVGAFAVGTLLAYGSSRLPASQRDLDLGCVIGVSWRHWLWLWLPWQYFLANLVWVGTPRFILLGNAPGLVMQVTDFVTSIISVCAVGYTGLRAVQSIRADGPLTRAQSAARFALWFFVGPVLVNLWRLFAGI